MNRITVATLALLAGSFFASLFCLEWPVSEIYIERIFGQRAGKTIEQGILFNQTDIVRSSGNGDILCVLEQNHNMYGFPGTLGNAVIVSHEDGLLSVYGNLNSHERIKDRVTVESGTILGSSGKTGYAKPGDLIFQVLDQRRLIALNPLLLLPSLADTKAPTIKNVIAVSSSGQSLSLGSIKSVRQGSYRIFADISDTFDKNGKNVAPFRVTLLLNGREYHAVPFELIKSEHGLVFLGSDQYVTSRLYGDPERIFLGEINLTRGKNELSILARDTAGNERGAVFTVQTE